MNAAKSDKSEISPNLAAQISDWIILSLLPVSFFILLTGLFWLWDRSLYTRLYYILVSAPTLVVLLLRQTGAYKKLLRNPLIITFILFGAYTILTLCWSDTDQAFSSLAKRPFNILLLFLAFGFLAIKSPDKLFRVFSVSARFAVASGFLSLIYFLSTHYTSGGDLGPLTRFTGYGALINPLLTSHVYGFFAAFFLALWFSGRDSHSPSLALSLGILLMVVISTGSRTPLLALTVTVIWLATCQGNRRSVLAVGVVLSLLSILLLLHPEELVQRGLSYRPEIWLESIKQGVNNLWLGHGFGHNFVIYIDAYGIARHAFYDPHNLSLGVFFDGGVVGLTLWLALYAMAMLYSWRNRENSLVLIASALIVFGFTAGLTEGGAFMSRLKEHWFLIWIPLALLSSAWIINTQQDKGFSVKQTVVKQSFQRD